MIKLIKILPNTNTTPVGVTQDNLCLWEISTQSNNNKKSLLKIAWGWVELDLVLAVQ